MKNEKYKSQYERYDYLKKLHICVNCGNQEAEPNNIYCFECKEKKNKKNKDYYAKNKESLGKKRKEYFKNLYYKRKENGICTKCGKRKVCKNSKTLCIDCYVKRKRQKDKRWNNDMPRAERVSFRIMLYMWKKKKQT